VQVQQRQHLGHLRRLTRPRRQDRRREPLPLPGGLIDALVVDPRRRTGTAPAAVVTSRGRVVAVADHQPVTVLVDLVGVHRSM
jgi:hypothetical protein